MAMWKKLLIGIGVFFVAMVVLGLIVGEDTDKDEVAATDPTTTTSAAAAPSTSPEAPPTPAAPAAPAGMTLAGPESHCTSTSPSSPLTIRSTTVTVGEIAGRPGTSAKVTIAYDGETPPSGAVLWSLNAGNPDGEQIQLGYKTVDGKPSSYFWFPFSEAQQHNMNGLPDTSTPGEITMIMPSAAVDALGSTWWWSSSIAVDGDDISTCGG
ncbi:hypothetical protein ABQF35_14135 [Mycobacterium syngnathidarum]